MNDTFDLRRFGLVLKKTILERPFQLAGLIVLTLVINLLLYAVCKTIVGFLEAQNITFIFGFIGGGTFLASMVLGYFSSNASGSSFLTLPASHFEKWVCAVIIAGVLFPCIYLAFYRLMDLSFVTLYHNGLDPKSPFYKDLFNSVNIFPFDGFAARKTYQAFVNFAGAMLVGSLYFNKVSFIKVALIICGLFIGGHLLDYAMAKAVFEQVDRALPYYCVFIPVGKDFGKVLLPDYASKAVDMCTLYIVPGILWLVAYIRLREKEF